MMPHRICRITLAAGLLLVSCSADPPATPRDEPPADPWEAARRRGIEFRALGQEPGWFLEIDEGQSMHLVYDYMEREATTPPPVRVQEGSSIVYRGSAGEHALTVSIQDQPCHDVMSGFEFPTTVTVTIDGRTLHGCGQRLQ